MTGLATFNPAWDGTRSRTDDTRVYEDADVLIATNFECGNGRDIRKTGENAFAVTLEPEPGNHLLSGWAYYFCIGLRNKTRKPKTISLDIEADHSGKFSVGTRHVIIRRGETWGHLDPAVIDPHDENDSVTIDVTLPGSEEADPTIFLSNFHWHPYTQLDGYLDQIRQDPRVTVSTYGRSSEGRKLYRVDLGNEIPGAPRIVMAQTPQPSECGTWTCRAIIDFLLSDEGAAVLGKHRFTLLPATNPDGTVTGLGVSHPSGAFPYFEGRLGADHDPNAIPEVIAEWELLDEVRPWLFVEWHSNNWARRPGHMLLRYRPHLAKNESTRTLWEDIDARLEKLPDTHHGNWTSHDEGMYQDSFGFQAVTRLGTIAYMIKHHDKFPLVNIQQHAVLCLREFAAAWDEHKQGS